MKVIFISFDNNEKWDDLLGTTFAQIKPIMSGSKSAYRLVWCNVQRKHLAFTLFPKIFINVIIGKISNGIKLHLKGIHHIM